jgi:hypothetical protein
MFTINGKIISCCTHSAEMHLYTDASSTKGFGGFYQGKWFYDTWPKELPDISDKTLSMTFLELYPIVVAAVLWGKDWSGKRILLSVIRFTLSKGSLACMLIVSKIMPRYSSSHQWHLFCVKWNDKYYHFVRLPFVCRSSPRFFDSLPTSEQSGNTYHST